MHKTIRCIHTILLLLTLATSGCSHAGENESSGGDIRAINHIKGQTINYFSVDGYKVPGLGGGYCCVMIPDKWRPGLITHIEWEVDPNPNEKIKRKTTGYGFDDSALAKHEANYQHHSANVEIPQYDKSGGLTVHFLTCNRVKVYAGIESYGAPDYPVKEALNMKEPASCP